MWPRPRWQNDHRVYLLDEFESFDLHELVTQCSVLHSKYAPECWVGDSEREAARQMIWDMPDRGKSAELLDEDIYGRYYPASNTFYPWRAPILAMEHPYEYFLPLLKDLLNPDRRQLF